jgi:diguanylate cyclase (GGDEF)-like protein
MRITRRTRIVVALAIFGLLSLMGLTLAIVIDQHARGAERQALAEDVARARAVLTAEWAGGGPRSVAAADATRLEPRVGRAFGVVPVAADDAPADVATAMPALLGGRAVEVQPTPDGQVAGTTLLRDAEGRPAFVLRVVSPRDRLETARQTIALLAGMLLSIGVLVLVVLRRLTQRLTTSLDALSDSELDRTFVEHTAEGIVLVDRQRGTILRCNDAAQRVFGELDEAAAATWLAGALGGFSRPTRDEGPREVRIDRPDGTQVDLEIVAQPIRRGLHDVLCVVMRDVSERKRVEQRIRHQAYHDGLTQLPNRALFNDRLSVALAQTRRTAEKIGVLLLDLDHFKTINDTMGHDLGDELLVQVSERLRRCVRDGDTIARLGGDEFVVLLPRLDSAPHAGTVAERILNALRAPFSLGGREVHISSSIGVAVHPEDGNDASTLFRNADLAMYHAKQQGRNAWMLHDASMNDQAADLLELKTELLYAMRNDEFFLELQPQVDGVAGALVGFEALVRWRSPKRGIVPPGRFIPVAEETGLIVAVGEWVLRAACKQVRDWLDAGLPAVRIAVNFSARQFLERDLVERVERALQETGCPPHLLEVEVTESIAMKNADRSVAALNAFRSMGMAVALDDFGTGYSSLAYLRQFPLDRLKMDRAFIKDVADTDNSRTMVDSIISLAHSLSLEVCAEGVETPEQLALLRSLGCDLLQGFGLARPMPSADATALLRAEGPARWAQFFRTALSPEASAARLVREPTNLH